MMGAKVGQKMGSQSSLSLSGAGVRFANPAEIPDGLHGDAGRSGHSRWDDGGKKAVFEVSLYRRLGLSKNGRGSLDAHNFFAGLVVEYVCYRKCVYHCELQYAFPMLF